MKNIVWDMSLHPYGGGVKAMILVTSFLNLTDHLSVRVYQKTSALRNLIHDYVMEIP